MKKYIIPSTSFILGALLVLCIWWFKNRGLMKEVDKVQSGMCIPLDSTYCIWTPVKSGDTLRQSFRRDERGDITVIFNDDTIMLRHKKNDYEK